MTKFEQEPKTFNQQFGVTRKEIMYLAELFIHPSKIDERVEIHGKPENDGKGGES